MWYHQVIGGGRCPIVDTWWQTETGAIMIAPLPGATPTDPRLGHPPPARDRPRDRHQGRQARRAPARAASSSSSSPGRRCSGPSTATTSATSRPTGARSPAPTSPATAPAGRGRQLLDHGPGRRRPERLRPPALDDGGRERPGQPPQGGRGRRRRQARRAARARRSPPSSPSNRARPPATPSRRSCRPTSSRRSAPWPAPTTSGSPTPCPRPAAARSCGGSSATSPPAARAPATPRPWKTSPSWPSSARRTRSERPGSAKPDRIPIATLASQGVGPMATAMPHPVSRPHRPDLRIRRSLVEPDGPYEVIDGQIVEKPPMGAFEGWIASYTRRDDWIICDRARALRRSASVEMLFVIDRGRRAGSVGPTWPSSRTNAGRSTAASPEGSGLGCRARPRRRGHQPDRPRRRDGQQAGRLLPGGRPARLGRLPEPEPRLCLRVAEGRPHPRRRRRAGRRRGAAGIPAAAGLDLRGRRDEAGGREGPGPA